MDLSSKSLYQDIFFRAFSDFAILILSLLILPLITRSVGETGYGVYSQVMATAGFLTPLLLLRLNTACVRYFPDIFDDKIRIKRNFILLLILIIAITVPFLSVTILNKRITSVVIFGTEDYADLIVFVSIFVLLRVISIYINNFYRALNKIKYASLFEVLRFFLIFASLFITLYKMEMGLKGLLLSYMLSEAILIILIFLSIFMFSLKGIVFSISYSWIKPYLKYSIPLVPYSALIWVNELGDRYLITHILGLKETGIYSVSYTIAKYAFILQSAISFVIYPYISQLWANGEIDKVESFLQKGQNLFLLQAIPITFGLTILSPYIIRTFAGDTFFYDRSLMFLISLGYIFFGIYQINCYVIDLTQKTVLFLIVLIVTGSMNIGLNLILIPIMGIKGAALSTFITYFLQAILILLLTPRLVNFRIRFDFVFMLKCTFAAIVMATAISFLSINNVIIHIILSVILGVILYMAIMYLITNKFNDYDLKFIFDFIKSP